MTTIYPDKYNKVVQYESMGINTELLCNKMTNGEISISGGIISGIGDPNILSEDDILVNKKYINSFYNKPGGVNMSVQYKNNDEFDGTDKLKVEIDNNNVVKLSVDGLVLNGLSSLLDNSVQNINNPINLSDACNKTYVDNSLLKTIINKVNFSGITYTPNEIYNTIIIRAGLTIPVNSAIIPPQNDISVRNIDYLPLGNDIIDYIKSINNNNIYDGYTFSFNIWNLNDNSSISVILQSQDNIVEVVPNNPIIYGSYQLSAKCIIISAELPLIRIEVMSCMNIPFKSFTFPGLNDNNWAIRYLNNNVQIIDTLRTNIQCLLPMTPINYPLGISHTYTFNNLINKLILRGETMTNDVIDYMDNVSNIYSDSYFNNYENGMGIQFSIQNINKIYSITLKKGVGWIFDDIVIPANYTGYFDIYFDKTNNLCYLFKLGILNRY